jgi:hypothetical protein
MIVSGTLNCTCGSALWIRDGIIVDDLELYELTKEKLYENNLIKATDESISNEHILQIKTTGEYIASYMKKIDPEEGVLFPNADSDLLIMNTDEIFMKNGLYMMLSYDVHSLIALKKRVEKVNLKGHFAFLCVSNKSPIKKTIKYVVDNGGNICDMIKEKEPNYSISKLKPLINDECLWLSIHVGFKTNESELKSDDERTEYLIMEKFQKNFEIRNWK